jgi:hypothetical protein
MATPKDKTTGADLLALGELQTALRQAVLLLRRLRARQCLNLCGRRSSRPSAFGRGCLDRRKPALCCSMKRCFRNTCGRRSHRAMRVASRSYQAKNPEITHGLFVGDRLLNLGRKS